MNEYAIGDIVETKKNHPCGSKTWEIIRVGVDFKLKCTGCGHIVPYCHNIVLFAHREYQTSRNMVLLAYTWCYPVAILYCLWTLNTISPQYCTACVHLIQSRDNIVLLAHTWYSLRRIIVLPVDSWYNLAKILHYLCTVSTLLLQNRISGRFLLLPKSRHNHFAPRLVILP